jgi:3-deoxy-7-phosphoheptulonate synthase
MQTTTATPVVAFVNKVEYVKHNEKNRYFREKRKFVSLKPEKRFSFPECVVENGIASSNVTRKTVDVKEKEPLTPRDWSVDSWRGKPAKQLPTYPSQEEVEKVVSYIKHLPPLVQAEEAKLLRYRLAEVCRGRGFVLQGGDCAESLEESTDGVRDTVRALFKMAMILMWGSLEPVVKIGRIGGQFAKPRSDDWEEQDGQRLPCYRGDIVNGAPFDLASRTPDPKRMLAAYQHSAATTNLVRALASGGFADLRNVKSWGMDWASKTEKGKAYLDTAERIEEAVRFWETCGVSSQDPIIYSTEVYTSHEALLLPYEEALCRRDPLTGDMYATSGAFIWIGERTRDLDGAHVEFARGVANPIGVKVGAGMQVDELLRLCDVLNPRNEMGRLTLITRMGSKNLASKLPQLVRALKKEGRHVVWITDAMHGNTYKTSSGVKTRSWNHILEEVRDFFAVHQAEGTRAGGVHFEMTGKEVTECVGGMIDLKAESLSKRYESLCDPRLNLSQSLELAFEIAEILKKQRQVK